MVAAAVKMVKQSLPLRERDSNAGKGKKEEKEFCLFLKNTDKANIRI